MTTGVVTEHLISLIAKQVEDHGLVVWYDPEQAYSAVVEQIGRTPRQTNHKGPTDDGQRTRDNGPRTISYTGSFFQLRHEIDGLMNDEQPPRLVVYVPLDQSQTDHALAELEAAGVVMQPGQQPPQRNTRLAIVARNALKANPGGGHRDRSRKAGGSWKADARRPERLGREGKGFVEWRAVVGVWHR